MASVIISICALTIAGWAAGKWRELRRGGDSVDSDSSSNPTGLGSVTVYGGGSSGDSGSGSHGHGGGDCGGHGGGDCGGHGGGW